MPIFHKDDKIETPADREKLAEQYKLSAQDVEDVLHVFLHGGDLHPDDFQNFEASKDLYFNLANLKESDAMSLSRQKGGVAVLEEAPANEAVRSIASVMERIMDGKFVRNEEGVITVNKDNPPSIEESYNIILHYLDLRAKVERTAEVTQWDLACLMLEAQAYHGAEFCVSQVVKSTGHTYRYVKELERIGFWCNKLLERRPELPYSVAREVILSGHLCDSEKVKCLEYAEKHGLSQKLTRKLMRRVRAEGPDNIDSWDEEYIASQGGPEKKKNFIGLKKENGRWFKREWEGDSWESRPCNNLDFMICVETREVMGPWGKLVPPREFQRTPVRKGYTIGKKRQMGKRPKKVK